MTDRVDLRLLPAAITAWAATWVALVSATAAWLVAGASAAAAGLLVLGVARSTGTGRTICLTLAAAMGLGVGIAGSVAVRVHDREQASIADFDGAGQVRVVARVVDWPRQRGGDPDGHLDSSRVVVPATAIAVGSSAAGSSVSPSWGSILLLGSTVDFGRLVPGEHVVVRSTVLRSTRPGLVSAVLVASGQPERLRRAPPHFRMAAAIRQSFAATADRALDAESAGLLPALVLGDETATLPTVRRDFEDSGLAHLTAVSGANFAIVALCVLALCAASGMPIGWRAGVTAAAIVAFAALVGPTGSVVRAAVMGLLGVAALALRRGRQPCAALLAAIVVLMVVDPALARDLGFVLSVSATAGLVLSSPVVRDWLLRRRWPRILADLVAVTFVAQMVTLPLVIGLFGRVPLGGFVANLLAGPVVPVITVVGTFAAIAAPLSPGVAELAARATGPELWWLYGVAQRCARIPVLTLPGDGSAAAAWGAVLVVCVVVGVVWQHKRRGRRRSGARGGGERRAAGRARGEHDHRGGARTGD